MEYFCISPCVCIYFFQVSSETFFQFLEIPFEIEVHTSDIRGAGTNANVFIVLYGDKGKSDEFWLRNKTDNFERGQVDKFKVHRTIEFPRNSIWWLESN